MNVTEDCLICLESLNPRGGRPLSCPGCCGKTFHSECVSGLLNGGNNNCPNCRSPFPGAANIVDDNGSRGSLFGGVRRISSSFMSIFQTTQPANPLPVAAALPPRANSPRADLIFRAGRGGFNHSRDQRRVHKEPIEATNVEELLDIVPEMKNLTKEVNEIVNGNLVLSSQAEKEEVTISGNTNFFVNVSMKASVLETTSLHRLPIDLVCVLDNSGSMSGSKLESVKEAMKFIRSQLSPGDRLSLINFNSNATVLHGLSKMTEENRLRSTKQLDTLEACGGTDIYDGMQKAFDVLFQRKTSNSLASIFLLTDGQDSSRMDEKMDLAKRMKSLGYSLMVFGFGSDHDDLQLKQIANAAEGTFTYIESDSMATEAFGGSLGGQQSLVGKHITLTITLPSLPEHETSAATILQAFTGKYMNVIDSNQRSVTIIYSNIFAGEIRDVLLKLSIPSVTSISNEQLLLTATANYLSSDNVSCQAIADPTQSSYRIHTPNIVYTNIKRVITESPNLPVNIAVDTQKNRILFVETMEAAEKSAREGKYEAASKLVRDCKMTMMSTPSYACQEAATSSMYEDLDESSVANSYNFNTKGGRANFSSAVDNYSGQRAMYKAANKSKSNPYQTEGSRTTQSSASTYKKGFW